MRSPAPRAASCHDTNRDSLKHIPGPAELAGTALFLATDDAAHMTGAYFNADGGFNMLGA